MSKENAERVLKALKGRGPAWTHSTKGLFDLFSQTVPSTEILDILTAHREELTGSGRLWLWRWQQLQEMPAGEEDGEVPA